MPRAGEDRFRSPLNAKRRDEIRDASNLANLLFLALYHRGTYSRDIIPLHFPLPSVVDRDYDQNDDIVGYKISEQGTLLCQCVPRSDELEYTFFFWCRVGCVLIQLCQTSKAANL
jgi:hypothetical protein